MMLPEPEHKHACSHTHTHTHTHTRAVLAVSGVSVALDSHRFFVNHNGHDAAMRPRPARARTVLPPHPWTLSDYRHRPPHLHRSDARDDVLSWFTSRKTPRKSQIHSCSFTSSAHAGQMHRRVLQGASLLPCILLLICNLNPFQGASLLPVNF